MAWLQTLTSAWESIEAVREERGDLEAAKHASRNLFSSAAEKADALKKEATERMDGAAEKLAQTCSEWTGREMSAAEVKKSAKIGAAVGAVLAAGPIAGMAMRQARAAGLPHAASHSGMAGTPGSDGAVLPDVPLADPTETWEQDDIEYDQMQYDNLQDDIQHQNQMNDVIDDQISCNEGMDFGGGCDF